MKSLTRYIQSINEGLQTKDMSKAFDIMRSYFKKYKLCVRKQPFFGNMNGGEYVGLLVYSNETNRGCLLSWEISNNSLNTDIGFFFTNAAQILSIVSPYAAMSEVNINFRQASLVKVLPLVKDILKGNMSLNVDEINDQLRGYHLLESTTNEALDEEHKKAISLGMKIKKMQARGEDTSELEAELAQLKSKRKTYMTAEPGKDVKLTPANNKQEEEWQKEFEEQVDPKTRFEYMERYVQMVLKGKIPSLIISGAPGLGKTYRVTQLVEQQKKMYDNYYLIKGKETPQSLYMTLFNYQRKGDLVILDDADDVINNDLSINILKAATDSSKKRIIAYGTSRPPEAPEQWVQDRPEYEWVIDSKGRSTYPKNFEYKGSIIIITNMRAGQIDTAIRNRAMLCELDFTTEEVLQLIREMMPILNDPNYEISKEGKEMAMDFLDELAAKNVPIELSFRSFIRCAQIFDEGLEANDPTGARYMVKEMMRLQFMRGGKRF